MRTRVFWLMALLLLLSPLILTGCGRSVTVTRPPVSSPDGSMTLHTRIEQSRADPAAYLCVVFEIHDRSGRVLHSENTRASDAMRWDMAWVSKDRIRLQSSDIGTCDWHREADCRWAKEAAPETGGQGTVPIPGD